MYLINKSTITSYLSLIAVGLALLASCSGGGGFSAGAGGSGIGGTGVTLVKGNVATVVAARADPDALSARMFARIGDLVGSPALAQSGSVGGIRVSGGGQSSVTDDLGRFELVNVDPSANFIINLLLAGAQQIEFSIGPVPKGATVQVNNIVVDASQGAAKPASVEVKAGSDDGDSSDNDGSGGDDGDSTDEPDEPDEPEDGTSSDEPEDGTSSDEPEDGTSSDDGEDGTSSDDGEGT